MEPALATAPTDAGRAPAVGGVPVPLAC